MSEQNLFYEPKFHTTIKETFLNIVVVSVLFIRRRIIGKIQTLETIVKIPRLSSSLIQGFLLFVEK